jgi:hypothetical protein
MIIKMFAALDKVNSVTENIRGVNLAAVKRTTIQETKIAIVAKATRNRA